MTINYQKIGWNSSKYFGPTNMNHMDDGIKASCNELDRLNAGQTIADNTDMNNLTTAGVYQSPTATSATLTHIPDYMKNYTFICEVFSAGQRKLQRITRVTDASICYQRVYSASAWSAWVKITTDVQEEELSKLGGMIKKATISGTTSASGNVAAASKPENRIILSATTNQLSTFAWVGIGSQGYYLFHVTNAAGAVVANTEVSIDYYYIEV